MCKRFWFPHLTIKVVTSATSPYHTTNKIPRLLAPPSYAFLLFVCDIQLLILLLSSPRPKRCFDGQRRNAAAAAAAKFAPTSVCSPPPFDGSPQPPQTIAPATPRARRQLARGGCLVVYPVAAPTGARKAEQARPRGELEDDECRRER